MSEREASQQFSPLDLLGVAVKVVQRLERDEKFRDSIRENPVDGLVEAGLPRGFIEGVVGGRAFDVAAAADSGPCCDLTCWSSACPATCSVTAISTTSCHCGHVAFEERVIR